LKIKLKRDLLSGVSFFTIALLVLFVAIPFGVQEPKKIKFAALNPSYYPRLVCYCLLIFGALLIARQIFIKGKNLVEAEAGDSKINPLYMLAIVAILAFYYLTLPYLGFVLASTIVLLVLLLLAGDRNIVALSLIPLLLPISVYWFFTKVANIPIPAGVLEPILTGG